MSSGLKNPTNQKRFTNVAVVRWKRQGKTFELACYKNKVVAWRTGLEKNLDEVLQTDCVFTNVSKGTRADMRDLVRCFPNPNPDDRNFDPHRFAVLEILAKGTLQVSDKERANVTETIFRDIVNVLIDQCIDSETRRPFPPGLVERALKDIHYNPHPTRSAKVQAFEALRMLQDQRVLPIQRAQMRISIMCPIADARTLKAKLPQLEPESETWDDVWHCIALVDPGAFRGLGELVTSETRGRGRVELLNLRVQEEGETSVQ
eukprot:gnl/Spiro4/28634_TR14170_c0_g1_i1.p1 gnl/Spiro4/28634_TR14170_c0_g1~~gnl/Spiro4/28634_TR14170_c0_g1_i1.p1  ORF type:complete len:276 (+),score=55.99 gnl/Spiro4/28634_TR14170_c0_g1_i1:48-830(+)